MRIAVLILVTILAGCAAQAAGPQASVDLSTLVKAHPLYSALGQYDRQIATLRATLHTSEFARKGEAFANAQTAVQNTLQKTAGRARDVAAMPSPDVSALVSNAGVNAPSEQRVRSDMQQTYDTQSAQLHSAAQQDMDRYRSALLTQQNTAFANYRRAVDARVGQAYNSRRQELYEKESTLALDLARRDAAQRLSIRAKLQTLALDGARRRALQAQLGAIQTREDATVAQLHARDRAQLAAFLPALQARANSDIARMQADLEHRTAANLASRERVLHAQTATAMRLNLGGAANAAPPASDMRGQLDALVRARPGDPGAFLSARDDLVKQFGAVQNSDDDATHSTWAELSVLTSERAQLYNDIVSQIMREADAVAKARGLTHVYASNQAPPGSTDITAVVRSDILASAR